MAATALIQTLARQLAQSEAQRIKVQRERDELHDALHRLRDEVLAARCLISVVTAQQSAGSAQRS